MPLVIMDPEILAILEQKRLLFNSQNQLMFLFTNNRTPDHADVISDYVAATYDGATGVPVEWTAPPVLDGDGGGLIVAGAITFLPTGTGVTNSVYGYFIVDTIATQLVAAERFPGGPYLIGNTLLPIVVVSQWRETSIP